MTSLPIDEQQLLKHFHDQPIISIDLDAARRDVGVIAFSGLALAALLVSVPQTFTVMARYHSHDEIGTVQAVASLVVFEFGAVISKLATLLFPQWHGRLTSLQVALLLFVAGANALATTAAAPVGETIQALAFAGLLPAFQFLFLLLAVARVKAFHIERLQAEQQRQPTQIERLQAALAEAQERQFTTMLEQMTIGIPLQQSLPASIRVFAQPGDTPALTAQGGVTEAINVDDDDCTTAEQNAVVQFPMRQTTDHATETGIVQEQNRNVPKLEKAYTCRKCGADGFSFAELGRHSRGCSADAA